MGHSKQVLYFDHGVALPSPPQKKSARFIVLISSKRRGSWTDSLGVLSVEDWNTQTKDANKTMTMDYKLVVSTHLKNMSQIGSFPQIGVTIKRIWNHQLDYPPTPNIQT